MKITAKIFQILIGCVALCVTSCQSPPGQGWKAETGFHHAVPVIAALEEFHRDRGTYPIELSELVPAYLSFDKLLLPSPLGGGIERIRSTAPNNPHMFSYDQNGNSYDLSFSYEGPGINRCFYDSKTKSWYSHGYY